MYDRCMAWLQFQQRQVKVDYSYLYKIIHKPTGLYYIGARYSSKLKKPPHEDFLHDYFTTSNAMKRLLFLHSPEDFEWELTPWDQKTIKAEEQRLLNETADDPLCLYQHPKKLWERDEYKEVQLAHKNDPANRTKASNTSTNLWKDPEYRAKQMANRAERKKKKSHNWSRTGKDNKRLSRQVTYGDVTVCKSCNIQFVTSPRHRNYCSQSCKSRAKCLK